MEIRVYRSMKHYSEHKPSLFCARIEFPDLFSFENAISVFRSIYGIDIVVVFIVV